MYQRTTLINLMPLSFYSKVRDAIECDEPTKKCSLVQHLYQEAQDQSHFTHTSISPLSPGYPARLKLVPPRALKRRGLQTQEGRNVLIHAIAHIEYNAINLSLDAAYRYQTMPTEFTRDWLRVAADEARHFELLRSYLRVFNCDYGEYPAHNGLWDMAESTQHDIVARMALVPRVLEARGLDVTPAMIKRLQNVNDESAANHLRVIYHDEIEHVRIGSRWFRYVCAERDLDPRETFFNLVDQYLHGELKGPFNLRARLKAGFDREELRRLITH